MEDFLKYLEYEKRYSPHTILSYQNDILQFSNYLKSEYEVDNLGDVSDFHIKSWLASQIDEGKSEKTVNRKLSVVRSFFHYLAKQSNLPKNPTKKIQGPKIRKRLPVYVEESRMEQLSTIIPKNGTINEFIDQRNRLIIELFYSTGIRRAELIGMKISDIDIYQSQIRVLGKRNKVRIIPLHKEILTLLTNYLSVRRQFFKSEIPDEWVFLTEKGEKIYPQLVYRIVNSYLSLVSTQDKKSPHVLRHTFATHMLNNGADLNAVKELLGHSSLAATQIYTHNTIEKLKKVYQQAHPKA